jgi:hypothetical protein
MRPGDFFLAIKCLKQQLLEQNGIIKKVIGQRNHGPDYTGSNNVARPLDLTRTVAPKIKTIE